MTNFIWPDDLNTLSETDCNRLLDDIRERRSKISATLQRVKKSAGQISDVKIRAALDKELLKFTKLLEKADKAISDVEKRLSNIAALRIQLEDVSGGSDEPGSESPVS